MSGANRYYSRNLATILEAQGRKRRWLAAQLGVSESLVSKISLGQRSADEVLAQRIALILGQPFFLLWELHERSDLVPEVERVA